MMPDIKPYGQGDNTFRTAGTEKGIKQLVHRFYYYMNTLKEAESLRAMHSNDLTAAEDKLYLFLCGWLGGEKRYSQKYGSLNIPKAHSHLKINSHEVNAWLLCMQRAAQDQNLPEEFIEYLINALAVPCDKILKASQNFHAL